MSSVLARFRISSMEDAKYAPDGAISLTLQAVQGEPFGSATPSGYLTMVIHNTAAAKVFKERYEKYVAEAKAWQEDENRKPEEYPKQPEFFVRFTPVEEVEN